MASSGSQAIASTLTKTSYYERYIVVVEIIPYCPALSVENVVICLRAKPLITCTEHPPLHLGS